MPPKYHIHTEPAPPRNRPVGKLGIVDWREDCSSCHNCVKKGCVYNLYRDEYDSLHDELGFLEYIYQCKGCLTCVQNCTKNLLTRVINPEFNLLGDSYFTPDIILTTWYQASSGSIPVSGAGYGGPFSGEGFDSMWTDMSEIVRPTRDGIHGREYINTVVDVGRKVRHLSFDGDGLAVTPPKNIEIPMPLMFDTIPSHWQRGVVLESIVETAAEVGLKIVLRDKDITRELWSKARDTIVPLLSTTQLSERRPFVDAPMIMLPDTGNVGMVSSHLKEKNPEQVVAVRVQAKPSCAARITELVRGGADVIHLVFDQHGREEAASNPRHARDVIREVHCALVDDGTRDEITLVASGGIALPEHMAKAIICGADLVAIDLPLIVALECRLCLECERGEDCQIELEEIEKEYAVRRMVNLIGTWHNQLLEMMGAMGIREARRLRGEVGRCMFFEDLERDTFERLFGGQKPNHGDQAK